MKTYTKILFAIMLMLTTITASAQVKAFEKYSDTEGVTYVYISKALLRMAGAFNMPSAPGTNMKNIIPKVDAIQIITSMEDDMASRLKREAENIVKSQNYELLMQVDDDGDKVRIYHHEGKKQSAIIQLTTSNDETVVIAFTGTFTLKDVESIVNSTKKK